MMPTSPPSSTTGRQPIFFSRIAFAACSMGSSGWAVEISVDIASETSILPKASARAGSPKAGVAERRSLSETIPTSRPPSRTGRCLMRRSRHSASASAAVISGVTVTTSRVIESLTSSIDPSPLATASPARIVYESRPSGKGRTRLASWYNREVTERLNQFLADKAAMLVEENFTGVEAEWWWERRVGGGIEVCQELDPGAMSREISDLTGRGVPEVETVVRKELGLESLEPVVLTFEVPGDTEAARAAEMLRERSSTPEGLAAPLYRRAESTLRGG